MLYIYVRGDGSDIVSDEDIVHDDEDDNSTMPHAPHAKGVQYLEYNVYM